MAPDPSVPWPRVVDFIKQHTHDMRNVLNGLELEAALLKGTVTDSKALESVARMRNQIRKAAANLRELSLKLVNTEPQCAPLLACDLFLIWQDQAKALDLHDRVVWKASLGTERVNLDAAGVAGALQELLVNAKQFEDGGTLNAIAEARGSDVVFELHESKSAPVDPSKWGSTPLCTTQRGNYGLGLWKADRLVRGSGGEVKRNVLQDGTLVTQFSFVSE